MKQSAVSFSSGDLELEGVYGLPDEAPEPVAGAVICHPHPMRGGSMDNPVVMAVYREVIKAGMAALRFNFRGVGQSQGLHSNGAKEPQDVLSAMRLLKELPGVDKQRIGLAGYSFGAGMVLGNVAKYKDCKAFALISPPTTYYDIQATGKDKRPKLFISGDQDRTVPIDELWTFTDSLDENVTCQVVEGADHFWGRYVGDLATSVASFFSDRLK